MRLHRVTYTIDTDRHRLDMAAITEWLHGTYWAGTRPAEIIARSWAGSAVVAGIYAGEQLVGVARVVSDGATTAYLADVFIVPDHRGRGLGRWLLETLVSHPDLSTVRWLLHTRDAHELYRRLGFQPASERVMERPRT
jgi:GNAT superfamily N-acetyltransferase